MNNIQAVQKGNDVGDEDMTDWELEKSLFYVHALRLDHLAGVTQDEIEALTEGQDKVAKLHDIIARINAITDKDGKINVEKDSELQKLLEEAKEMGVKLSKTEGEFTDKEKERVVENIRFFIEDLNTKNDMKLQGLTRLTNEKYEMYNLTRMCLKVLDEDKKNKARAIKGG